MSGDYFSLLGVNPGDRRGRSDPTTTACRTGIRSRCSAMATGSGGSRAIRRSIGRTIRLSATPFTIVGVTPPEFFGVEIGTAPDIFVPIMMQPTVMPAFENLLENPIVSRSWVQVIARTKPGISPDQAAAAMDASFQSQQANPARGPAAKGRTAAGPSGAHSGDGSVELCAGSFPGRCSFCWPWSASCC